jgi:hypothetical protein
MRPRRIGGGREHTFFKHERWRSRRRQTWRRVESGGGVAGSGSEAHDSRAREGSAVLASGEDNYFSLGLKWIGLVFLKPGVTQMHFSFIHVGGTPAWVGFPGRPGSLPIPADPRLSKRSLRVISPLYHCSYYCSISIKLPLHLNCKSTSFLFSPPYLNPGSAIVDE